MSQVTIRPATRADSGTIVDLIHELAVYEKLAHEVTATESDIERSLFGERSYAEVLIASVDDATVGFALFFHTYSTFLGRPGLYLEDLFVRPEARGRGIGRALLARLARIGRERECGRIEWSVLDWNTPAIRFYEQLGARPMNDWAVFRLDEAAMEALAGNLNRT